MLKFLGFQDFDNIPVLCLFTIPSVVLISVSITCVVFGVDSSEHYDQSLQAESWHGIHYHYSQIFLVLFYNNIHNF